MARKFDPGRVAQHGFEYQKFVYYYLIISSSCASKDKDTYLFLKTEACKDIFYSDFWI
jgi:hypothetical protein